MNIKFMTEIEIYLGSKMEMKYKNTFCKCSFVQNRSHFQWKLYSCLQTSTFVFVQHVDEFKVSYVHICSLKYSTDTDYNSAAGFENQSLYSTWLQSQPNLIFPATDILQFHLPTLMRSQSRQQWITQISVPLCQLNMVQAACLICKSGNTLFVNPFKKTRSNIWICILFGIPFVYI